jgi:hypothetical protein
MICFWIVCNLHYDYLTVDYYAVVKVRTGLVSPADYFKLVGAEVISDVCCFYSS